MENKYKQERKTNSGPNCCIKYLKSYISIKYSLISIMLNFLITLYEYVINVLIVNLSLVISYGHSLYQGAYS